MASLASFRLAAGAAVLLGACATAPEPRPLPQLAAAPAAFEMTGRLAVRQGERSEIARLRWTHRPASDLWVIASPLGNEVARIESGSGGATLSQGGAEPQTARSFADLTEKLLGVALEPAALAGWLHGGSTDTGPDGWRVTVDETQRAGALDLARRISAVRADVVVRLVVDEYRALAE